MSKSENPIDFVAVAFVIHQDQVLLIHHIKSDMWLPLGGHIEKDEDPIQALYREIEEESGLAQPDLTILSTKPNIDSTRTKALYQPNYLDIHKISQNHKHVGLIYFLTSSTPKITLNQAEHHQIGWFNQKQLKNLPLTPEISFYSIQAINHARTFIN